MSTEFQNSSCDLILVYSHVGHSVTDFAWCIALDLPNGTSSFYLSTNAVSKCHFVCVFWEFFFFFSFPWILVTKQKISKFKTAASCKAVRRSMFWLQCNPSKRYLLFLPVLRLFCLLESGVPRGPRGWWERKQTRCLYKHSLFFWPSRDLLGNGKACSASWEN